jgi:Tol biopolymer transport system component
MACRRIALTSALTLLALPAVAHAAFPGANGKIAWDFCPSNCTAWDLYAIDPDGTNRVQLTNDPARDLQPAFSPDGSKIAFTTNRDGNFEIYVMDASGANAQRLTSDPASDTDAAWSPDGSKIAFDSDRGSGGIWVMNADGSAVASLAPGSDPAWSPDGTRIAFTGPGDEGDNMGPTKDIWVMDADGANRRRITINGDVVPPCGPGYATTDESDFAPNWSPSGDRLTYGEFILDLCLDGDSAYAVETVNVDGTDERPVWSQWEGCGLGPPVWSPNGSRIAFSYCGLRAMNADGSGSTFVDSSCCLAGDPDWQPLPVNTPSSYARPKGASPSYISLVPAYAACSAANRTHGAPLAHGSCAAPVRASSNLTVGSPDANGKIANSLGFIQLITQLGTPGGPDDSDVALGTQVKSVYNASGLTDYAGSLEARLTIRLTDKQAGVSSTAVEFPLSFAVPCTATADPNTGSTCTLISSADALQPGLVPEGQRSIWALDQAKVYDGGADGDAGTSTDNQLFQTQGVFVP